MSEKTITIPQHLYEELAELQHVDETIPNVIERLVAHYKDTTEEMTSWFRILEDDSTEWQLLEQRIKKKLSMNDAAIVYQWRLICKKIAETATNPNPPKPPDTKKSD